MWPFKSKSKLNLPILVFESGEAFVQYHCGFMVTKLKKSLPISALVIDAREHFKTEVAVKTDDRGIQIATLRVASDDGGFIVLAETSGEGDPLIPGDTVAWLPMEFMPKLGECSADMRFGWVGLIVAKIAPEIDISKKAMTVLCHY